MSPIYVPGKLTLRQAWQPMDPDAAAYIAAVEAADGQPLEEKVKIAIDDFVLGCKADGIWSAIKASCILAGARTLNGALVPLAGAAPTNFNFVAGDYNRKIGLRGDGSVKYLNANRNNNADPQNSRHLSAFATEKSAVTVRSFMGTSASTGLSLIFINSASDLITSLSDSNNSTTAGSYAAGTGLLAISRSNGDSYTLRASGVNTQISVGSIAPASGDLSVFARGAGNTPSSPRLAFYSIGESLNLALLDARVTDLINTFARVIP